MLEISVRRATSSAAHERRARHRHRSAPLPDQALRRHAFVQVLDIPAHDVAGFSNARRATSPGTMRSASAARSSPAGNVASP
jgi:hypothetical protein